MCVLDLYAMQQPMKRFEMIKHTSQWIHASKATHVIIIYNSTFLTRATLRLNEKNMVQLLLAICPRLVCAHGSEGLYSTIVNQHVSLK